jgi:malonate transporter and related proteins
MSVVSIVVPVFALIAIGYAAARWRLMSEAAQKGLAEFSATFAIPALLFRTIAGAEALPVSPLDIWAAFFGALAITWALAAIATRVLLRRPAIDAASIAMTATYGNTVMLGIPLCLAVFGDAAAAPIAVILSIHTALLWGFGTLQHQWVARSAATDPGQLILTIVRDLLRNPLILAIIAGGFWRLTGLGLAPVPDRILALLGQAGVPTALVALGTSLAGFAIKGQGPTLTAVICLKLLVMPAIAAVLSLALGLPPAAAGVVVLFAGMPSGANAYLFASKVDRAVNSASGAVALGTLLSLVTVSLMVAWLPR